jgi:hypothetical protein
MIRSTHLLQRLCCELETVELWFDPKAGQEIVISTASRPALKPIRLHVQCAQGVWGPLSYLFNVHRGSEAHSAPCSMCTGGLRPTQLPVQCSPGVWDPFSSMFNVYREVWGPLRSLFKVHRGLRPIQLHVLCVQGGPRPTQLPVQCSPGVWDPFSPVIERPEIKIGSSSPTRVQVKNTCIRISTPPHIFMACKTTGLPPTPTPVTPPPPPFTVYATWALHSVAIHRRLPLEAYELCYSYNPLLTTFLCHFRRMPSSKTFCSEECFKFIAPSYWHKTKQQSWIWKYREIRHGFCT